MSSAVQQSRSLEHAGAVYPPSPATPQCNPAPTDHPSPPAFAAPSRPSPVQINEILYSVFSLLDQKTLKTAVYFVCRRWRFVATRYIVHSIRLHHDNKKIMETLQSQLLNVNALEVGQKITRSCRPPSYKDAARWNEMLDQLVQTLERIQSSTGNSEHRSIALDSQHPHGLEDEADRLQIRILTLNLQVPDRLDQLLSMIVPSNLRELTIDVEFSDDPVHLGTILDLCTNLLKMTLSSHKVRPGLRRKYPKKSETWLHPDSSFQGKRPHPLRSLHITNMSVSRDSLQSYFARLGNLNELHCFELRNTTLDHTEYSRWEEGELRDFFETLARNCPLLESLHFPLGAHGGYTVPVELFPRIHDYRIDTEEYSVIELLEGILANGVESRLTTLEFVVSKLGRHLRGYYYYPQEDHEVCNLLHQVLCAAPLLLHLNTGIYPLPSRLLWGNGDQTSMWACRRLKTLSLVLERDLLQYRGSTAEARHVFAYISRFCPELEELEIMANCPGLSLKSGLCLLTRLKNLQSLTVKGDFLINDPPDRRELAWIQTPSNPAAIRTSSTSKWLPLFLQGSSVMGAPSVLEEAYLQCIDMAQSLEDNTDTTGRLRMQQQQRDNQFCSEYEDQAFPMVDGLVDMEFFGSYLDIEACLQAQLFRLRRLQHLQALYSGDGPRDDASIKELKEAAKAAEVWPQMKTICLSHDYPNRIRRNRWYRGALTPPWHIEERGGHMLQDLRPDIIISRQE